MKRTLSILLLVALPAMAIAEGKYEHGPQTLDEFLDLVKNTKEGQKYYKPDVKVIDFSLKQAVANLEPPAHRCYDVRVTSIFRDHSGKMIDQYTKTMRWQGKNKLVFGLQKKNLTGNDHWPARIRQPKDGFFSMGAELEAVGAKQTRITMYYRGGFMSGIAKKMFTPVFAWSQGKKAKCVTIDKKF